MQSFRPELKITRKIWVFKKYIHVLSFVSEYIIQPPNGNPVFQSLTLLRLRPQNQKSWEYRRDQRDHDDSHRAFGIMT